MKNLLSKKEALEKINNFSKQKEFGSEEIKKIKRLAMKYHIRIKEQRKKFCKKCYCNLSGGKIRLKKGFKAVLCPHFETRHWGQKAWVFEP